MRSFLRIFVWDEYYRDYTNTLVSFDEEGKCKKIVRNI